MDCMKRYDNYGSGNDKEEGAQKVRQYSDDS